MSLNKRRILYSLFILAFLVITPLVSLYAGGYKIGGGFKIQKTGILILDTRPQGATISLNGKIQRRTISGLLFGGHTDINTPAKIKNLLPGEYDVTLSLPGYWPWNKRLDISPGQSTYAEDVVLFKNDLPLTVTNGDYSELLLSPSERYLAATGNGVISIIDLEPDLPQAIYTATSSAGFPPESIRWSPDGKRLSAGNSIITPESAKPSEKIPVPGGQPAGRILWLDNSQLTFRMDNIIYRYHLGEKAADEFYNAPSLGDYSLENGKLITIESSASETRVVFHDATDRRFLTDVSLPLSRYGLLDNGSQSLTGALDTDHHILYLLDPFSAFNPIFDTINDVTMMKWIDDRHLVFANEHEIWLYDLNNKNSQLLTRISEQVNSILWHPSDNYVIYSTGSYIATIELDKRDRYNITRIIELTDITAPVLTRQGDSLYFGARIGNQQGVYQLVIQ